MDGITTPPVTPYAIGLLPERSSQVGHKERDGNEEAMTERTTAGDLDGGLESCCGREFDPLPHMGEGL
jgi:hypothetical protein